MDFQRCLDGVVNLRLHLGHKSSLPAGFVRRYCAESCGEWIWRQLMRCLGAGYSHFRMRVERYDEAVHGVFSWRLEDAFRVLRDLPSDVVIECLFAEINLVPLSG